MADDKSEALAIFSRYRGNPDGLAEHLKDICLMKLGVVYQVFALLDDFSDIDVGTRFLRRINGATLNTLVTTNEGIAFAKFIYNILNVRGQFNFRSAMPTQMELFVLQSAILNAKIEPNDTAQPKKLSEAEIAFYRNEAAKKKQKFNEDIVWELPRNGTGFTVYKPEDVAVDGLDQIGTKEMIEIMISSGEKWASVPGRSKLQYGDISRAGGLPFSKIAGHHTHKVGMAFDMRILRKDKAMLGLTISANEPESSQYDRAANKEYILFMVELYPETTVYFNDPVLIKELKGIVEAQPGHWHHLHVMPYRKGRER